MIPTAYLIEWQAHTPWKTADMIEQDLLISRAITDIFSHPDLKSRLAFRCGTALHKLGPQISWICADWDWKRGVFIPH